MGKHVAYTETPRLAEWLTPTVRAWAYSVVIAIIAILGGYGVITDTLAPLWVALAAALLGQGAALAHTPKRIISDDSRDSYAGTHRLDKDA
ncbi:hypothetical protein [uncultured Varibaculum sp.]|uniref:phage holin n=1 Tax=uncultured Varibaculum sp. TaxID=413896 RepID=UPI002593A80A|nr:hypothetical protein [uncultured Varibaculum sp.]